MSSSPRRSDNKGGRPVGSSNSRPPKIAVGMVAYNEQASLPRCLDSLVEFDHVIVCEGRYDVNTGNMRSDDSTREIIHMYDNTTIIDVAGMKQTDARNMYMKKAAELECDYVLAMEADEYITNTRDTRYKHSHRLDRFRENLPAHNRQRTPRDLLYNIHMNDSGHWVLSPRLMYRPDVLRYGNMHHSYIVNGDERMALVNSSILVIEGIFVQHDETLRSAEHQHKADLYGKGALTRQEKDARDRLKDRLL